MNRHNLNVLVAGMIAGHSPQGGAAWATLQYVLGLRRLGHEVHLVEFAPNPTEDTRRYFNGVIDRFGITGQLIAELRPLTGFDVLFNLSGMLVPEVVTQIPIRVYLDLDPGFNQLWHQDGIDMHFDGHTHFVTVGLAIGTAECNVPTHGFEWIRTVPPVVLDAWPVAKRIETNALTTVANFRSYGPILRGPEFYGQKVHSLRELIHLPELTGERFALAMTVHPAEHDDLAALEASGWELVDPVAKAGTPDLYRDFVSGSRGEIGIAKSGYVVSRCGWFSDRSACYLASGRPVIAQETGFSGHIPTGTGILAFNDVTGAAVAVEQVRSEYTFHAHAARRIAEEYFDSDRVLRRLLERTVK